jgi:hypothetical protein
VSNFQTYKLRTNGVKSMDTNVGIDRLEAPCLGHIQGNPNQPDLPSGHALTASAPLLFLSGSENAVAAKTTDWQAPNALLERLLTLSASVIPSGEISPVQAWNYIIQNPDFPNLEVDRMRTLTEKMLKEVKCHG